VGLGDSSCERVLLPDVDVAVHGASVREIVLKYRQTLSREFRISTIGGRTDERETEGARKVNSAKPQKKLSLQTEQKCAKYRAKQMASSLWESRGGNKLRR